MLLNPADQYHLGLVVDDFEAARASFTESMGYEWGPEIRIDLTLSTPDGVATFPHRLQYSITEPRLELIQSVPGTPFQPSNAGLHHYGYWCDDIPATGRALEQAGWTWECGGEFDGVPVWGYHHNPVGMRIEIVNRAMMATSQGMWTRG